MMKILQVLLLYALLFIRINNAAFKEFCVHETGLDLSLLHLVNPKELNQLSADACASKCLEIRPETEYIFVSHYEVTFFRDSFNCVCGLPGSVDKMTGLGLEGCEVNCPQGNKKCGDGTLDLLKAYCLKESCEHEDEVDVCSYKEPYLHHGCTQSQLVNWEHAISLEDLIEDRNCVWECHRRNTTFAVTSCDDSDRKCQCTCLHKQSIQRENIIANTFCGILPKDDRLEVRCSEDVGEEETCLDSPSMGCINSSKFQFNSSILLTNVELVSPGVCQDVCRVSQPRAASVAVIFNQTNQSLECRCSTVLESELQNSLNLTESVCEIQCGGKACGGRSLPCNDDNCTKDFSLSVYCVPDHTPAKSQVESKVDGNLHPRLIQNLRVAGQNMATSLVLLSSIILVVCITMCFTLLVFKNKIA